jgi:hypothetical protein
MHGRNQTLTAGEQEVSMCARPKPSSEIADRGSWLSCCEDNIAGKAAATKIARTRGFKQLLLPSGGFELAFILRRHPPFPA